MSLTFLIGGLRVQHTALLYRQMRFRSLAIRDVASNVLAVPVGIALAMRGAGYWAIVALPLTFNFAQMVITWLLVRWIPGPPRRSSNVRSLIAFGGSVAGSYLITNIMANADNVLIGWYWGAGPLGFYSRAYNLLMLPVRQLNGPAGSVAVPAFSRLQNDPERFARYYLRMVKLMMWAGAPIFGFLFAAADPVIVVVLGKKWMDAAPVFRILAISALAQMVLGSGIWVLVSRGLSSRLLKVMLVVSSITVASFAVGLPFGVKGVAWAGSLTLACVVPWMLHSSFKGTDITLTRLGQAILIPILLCLTGVGVAELGKYLVVPQSLGARLLVAALSFAGTYALSIAIRPVREELFSFRELLGELRGTAAS
jgi:PST family polysaccharide transporter